jgi:hypothetical protein
MIRNTLRNRTKIKPMITSGIACWPGFRHHPVPKTMMAPILAKNAMQPTTARDRSNWKTK